MKMISKEALNSAYRFIKSNCDDLHTSLFEYHFFKGSMDTVLKYLKTYQNEDGGFGNGLEPDFTLPDSSPMATTIAFQILDEIGEKNNEMAYSGLKFYENNFDRNRNGWWAVPVQVNDFPHAPWWNYDARKKCTVIDNHWGNPSSEIIGTLYEYRSKLQLIDIDRLIGHAIIYLNELKEYKSEHELYCYIRMYKKLPEIYQRQLKETISKAVKDLICLDVSKWNTYVPKPLDFVQSRHHPLFAEIEEYVEENCDYLVDTIKDGLWHPAWKWNQYEAQWEESKKNWIAFLTIKHFKLLREFNRFE